MKRFWFLVLSLALVYLTGLLTADEKPASGTKSSWKIAGQLEEACKCNAACPCWFGAKPTHMNCGGQLVYFITKGKYNNVSLDGLAYARMGQSPDGQSMMESFGNWVFDYLYIDEKANDEQRKALEALAYATEPKESSKTQIRYVPITRTIEGNVHHITIGQYGTFSAHLLDSLLGGAPKIVHAPGADPIRSEFLQGVTTIFKYNDASQDWNSQGSNYMFTDFNVDSVQYEKFGTTMMHMMEQMKKQKTGSQK
jgi:hypothetical protein